MPNVSAMRKKPTITPSWQRNCLSSLALPIQLALFLEKYVTHFEHNIAPALAIDVAHFAIYPACSN